MKKPKQGKKPGGRSFLHRHFPNVKEVVDATKAVKVIVQSRDNVEGRKKQPTECAMAKAMRREFNADGVIIGLSRSYIIRGDKAVRYQTPDSVARELVSFDRHQDFAPGVYSLSPISPSSHRGYSGSQARGRGTRPIVHKATARVRTLKE